MVRQLLQFSSGILICWACDRPVPPLHSRAHKSAPCAFFTQTHDVLHLQVFRADSITDQIELGIALPVGSIPRNVHVFRLDPIFPPEPLWRTKHGAYARAWKSPNSIWFADSGWVSIEILQDDRIVGKYVLWFSFSPLPSKPTTPFFTAATDFDAPRDTLYERYMYRSAAAADSTPPPHICSRLAPA